MPPYNMVNTDFLKSVLAEEKDLLEMSELKPINVASYDEVSVKVLFP